MADVRSPRRVSTAPYAQCPRTQCFTAKRRIPAGQRPAAAVLNGRDAELLSLRSCDAYLLCCRTAVLPNCCDSELLCCRTAVMRAAKPGTCRPLYSYQSAPTVRAGPATAVIHSAGAAAGRRIPEPVSWWAPSGDRRFFRFPRPISCYVIRRRGRHQPGRSAALWITCALVPDACAQSVGRAVDRKKVKPVISA